MVELQHAPLKARGQTSSWHLQWPGRLAALVDETQAKKVLEELQVDFAAMEEAKKQESVFWKKICGRSILEQTRMKQFLFLAQQSEWNPSAALRQLATVTFAGILGTKMIEDANKVQRTSESSRNFAKRLQDQRAWSCLIQSQLAEKTHRFKQVSPSLTLPTSFKDGDIEGLFVCRTQTASKQLREICSERKQAEWFSPNAVGQVTFQEDLALVRRCNQGQKWERARAMSWTSCVFNGHNLAVGQVCVD